MGLGDEMLRREPKTEDRGNPPRVIGIVLRNVTGWTLLAAAVGIFIDANSCNGCSEGSIGLIPLYLGFPIGSVGLVIVFKKAAGWIPALIAAVGLSGLLYFMFAYPNGAEGWIGAVLVGVAHLFLPLSGRLASIPWVAVGILGFPAFGANSWGPITAFSMFGVSTAVSGIFVLWGLKSEDTSRVLEES